MTVWRIATLLTLLASPAAANTPEGTWLTQDRDGVIRIAPCGDGLCGRIVGMSTFAPDGTAPKDTEGRSQCGLEIIHTLIQAEPGIWIGKITNPENGRRYNARLSRTAEGHLTMRGSLDVPLVPSLFGETQIWTKYAGWVTPDCRMTR